MGVLEHAVCGGSQETSTVSLWGQSPWELQPTPEPLPPASSPVPGMARCMPAPISAQQGPAVGSFHPRCAHRAHRQTHQAFGCVSSRADSTQRPYCRTQTPPAFVQSLPGSRSEAHAHTRWETQRPLPAISGRHSAFWDSELVPGLKVQTLGTLSLGNCPLLGLPQEHPHSWQAE